MADNINLTFFIKQAFFVEASLSKMVVYSFVSPYVAF